MSRQDRVREAIRREASIIIHDELKDPRLGFITVTRVEMTPDLRYARIFFSVLGKEEDYKKTQQALDSALGYIRSKIVQRINLRLAPDISFQADRSSEYSVRIQEVLEEIKHLHGTETPVEKKTKPKKKKEGRRERKKGRRVYKKK
ncbi:MAG: 30S ribosome-binding factor RbfA [Candidatus Omnitrophota bacterium]